MTLEQTLWGIQVCAIAFYLVIRPFEQARGRIHETAIWPLVSFLRRLCTMLDALEARISEHAKPNLEECLRVDRPQIDRARGELRLFVMDQMSEHQIVRGVRTENLLSFVGRDEESAEEEEESAEGWSNLREELQERILARLPLSKLFQVPVLSKGWRFIFQSQAFQDEVTSVSYRWSAYCPVHLSRKGLVGYDAAAQLWKKLFTLSYLPYVPQGHDVVSLCSGAGSLICFARRNKMKEREMFRLKHRTSPVPRGDQDFFTRLQQFCNADTVDGELSQEAQAMYAHIDRRLDRAYPDNLGIGAFDIYVTNVVTKRWKVLPCRPCMPRPDIVQLLPIGTSAYKVILLTLIRQRSPDSVEGVFCVQIYNSKNNSWTSRNSSTATISSLEINLVQACVYLDGVFYIIVQNSGGNRVLYEVLTYNVEHHSWTRIPNPEAFTTHEFIICELAVCGSHIMLITGRKEWDRVGNLEPSLVAMGRNSRDRLLVSRLDMDLMSFVVYSRGPSARVLKGVSNVDLVVGAGDSLYFGLRSKPSDPILVFSISRKQWRTFSPANNYPGFGDYLSNFRWTKYPFQPGLNPFLKLA